MMQSDESYLFNADSQRFCWVSQGAEEASGYCRQELLFLNVSDVFPALQQKATIQALSVGETSNMVLETLQQPKLAFARKVRLQLDYFIDQGKPYVHIRVQTCSAYGVSQQQQLLAQFAMDNVFIEVYWLDRNGYIRYANRKACRVLGYTQQEMAGLRMQDIEPHYSLHKWREDWEILTRQELVWRETELQSRNGKRYPVNVLSHYVQLGDEEYHVAFARDISSVQQYEARFRNLVSMVDVIIWSCNANWILDYVSPQVNEILGLSSEEFLGLELRSLLCSERFHPEDRASLQRAMSGLSLGSSVRNLPHRIMNGKEQWQWMAVSMSAILDVNGELQQIVGSVHDIGQQKREETRLLDLNAELDKRVQQALADKQKSDLLLQQQAKLSAMGDMIGNIAHQWRQPLNALAIIMMNLDDALAYGEADEESIHKALARSQDILSNMSRTIDDFRGFLKNDNVLTQGVLSDCVKSCLHFLQATMAYHNIQLKFVDEGCAVRVMMDAGKLSKVLLNLINNAKEQIMVRQIADGEIVIGLEQKGAWAVITVTDNAGGIEDELLSKIFEPYFSTKSNGVGLGLFMSSLTMQETMNGRIEAKNVNGGAQFSVYLPQIPVEEYTV